MAKGTVSPMSSDARENEYRAKEDARTLTDGELIRSDPHRLKHAKRHLRHAAKALRKLSSRK